MWNDIMYTIYSQTQIYKYFIIAKVNLYYSNNGKLYVIVIRNRNKNKFLI